MNMELIVALISSGFSLLGVILTCAVSYHKTQQSFKAATNLTIYRIEQLEKKQDKHNTLIERMYKLEQRVNDLEPH